jgi:hypothetical protein
VKDAWELWPHYNNTSTKFVITTTKQNHKVRSDNISEVATAAAGKVDTLLIEAELQIPGMIINGSIEKRFN